MAIFVNFLYFPLIFLSFTLLSSLFSPFFPLSLLFSFFFFPFPFFFMYPTAYRLPSWTSSGKQRKGLTGCSRSPQNANQCGLRLLVLGIVHSSFALIFGSTFPGGRVGLLRQCQRVPGGGVVATSILCTVKSTLQKVLLQHYFIDIAFKLYI